MVQYSREQFKQLLEGLKAAGKTDSEIDDIVRLEGITLPPTQTETQKARNLLARALDYPSGLGRGAVGGAVQALGGPDLGVNLKDVLTGNAPSTKQMLARGGVPAGPSLSDALPFAYSPTGNEWLQLQKGGWADPTARGSAGFAGDVALDPLTYVPLLGEAKATKYANPLGETIKASGKPIYKMGMNRIDQEALKHGKEPVSDYLFSQGVRGNAAGIQNQMDVIGERLLSERDQILKDATRAGGEVSMREAMAPSIARIAEIRASKDPQLIPVADAMSAEVQKYLALDAKPSEQYLRTLPVRAQINPSYTELNYVPPQENLLNLPTQGKLPQFNPDASKPAMDSFRQSSQVGYYQEPGRFEPGKTIPETFTENPPQTVIDWTDPTMGPTPIQGSQYKTTVSNQIPQAAWTNKPLMSAYSQGDKTLRGGLQSATESSVERSLGPEAAADLKQKNYNLGQILTTKQKQEMEAFKEANKPNFSAVDAMLAGTTATNPMQGAAMLGVKKTRDLLMRPRATTNIGLAFDQYGNAIPDSVWRQILLGAEPDRGQ